MEVRIESMICVWDDKIPTLFLEFVNLLTLSTSEEGLRKSVKEFAEKHELDKFFLHKKCSFFSFYRSDLTVFCYNFQPPI